MQALLIFSSYFLLSIMLENDRSDLFCGHFVSVDFQHSKRRKEIPHHLEKKKMVKTCLEVFIYLFLQNSRIKLYCNRCCKIKYRNWSRHLCLVPWMVSKRRPTLHLRLRNCVVFMRDTWKKKKLEWENIAAISYKFETM